MLNYRNLLGMGGVPPHDQPAAYVWERRLHWVMVAIALLVIPAFYLQATAAQGWLSQLATYLNTAILLAFSLEFLWMLYLTRQRWAYISYNWLNLLIIFGAAVNLVGVEAEWLPLVRLLRIAYVSLVLARALGAIRNLLAPTAIPYLLGWAVLTLALAGAGFYWLEPTVHSYGDGLWLAFTTGSTVGYGDIVPTTTASRIFAVIMVIFGFGMLSLVTASFVAFFIGEDEKKLRREMHNDIKELRLEVHKLRTEMAELMRK